MELSEFKMMWQEYDQKLERSLKLNLHCLEMIKAQKIKSKLKPLLYSRVIEAIAHILIIGWLLGFLYNNYTHFQFAISAIALIIFYGLSLINCIKQVITIKQINYNEEIIIIQKKLSELQSHAANYVSLIFLCIPIYLAYPVIAFKVFGNFDITALNGNWWAANLIFSLVILPICIWLYMQVSYKNIQKKWVKYLIEKLGGQTVRKAMEFTKELDEMKQ